MSSRSKSEITILIRRRLGADVSERLRFLPLIDDAGLLLAREVADDPLRRHLMLTDAASTTVAVDGAGVADLTALIASPRILIDKLQCGRIYDPSNAQPIVLLANSRRALLPGNYDTDYLHAWLDGHKLRTVSSDNNAAPLLGPLSLAVPYWATLAQQDDQLNEALVEKSLELLEEHRNEYEAEDEA